MSGDDSGDADSGIQSNWLDDKNANTARAGRQVDIDIVGFSRGAAMSRDFANRVATRLQTNTYKDSGACVQIRFLGLWDTVAQFGLNGADNGSWQLAIRKRPTLPHMNVDSFSAHFGFHFGEPNVESGTRTGLDGAHCAMA